MKKRTPAFYKQKQHIISHYRLQTCRSDFPESHRKSHLTLMALFHSFSFHLSTVYSSASCFMRLVCCFDWDSVNRRNRSLMRMAMLSPTRQARRGQAVNPAVSHGFNRRSQLDPHNGLTRVCPCSPDSDVQLKWHEMPLKQLIHGAWLGFQDIYAFDLGFHVNDWSSRRHPHGFLNICLLCFLEPSDLMCRRKQVSRALCCFALSWWMWWFHQAFKWQVMTCEFPGNFWDVRYGRVAALIELWLTRLETRVRLNWPKLWRMVAVKNCTLWMWVRLLLVGWKMLVHLNHWTIEPWTVSFAVLIETNIRSRSRPFQQPSFLFSFLPSLSPSPSLSHVDLSHCARLNGWYKYCVSDAEVATVSLTLAWSNSARPT